MVCSCFVAGVRGGLEASSGLKPQRRCRMEGTCIGAWQHSEGASIPPWLMLAPCEVALMGPSLSVETRSESCSALPGSKRWVTGTDPAAPGPPALCLGLPQPAVLKQVGRPGGAGSPGGNLLVLVGARVAAGPFRPRGDSACMERLSLSVEQARLCPDPAVSPVASVAASGHDGLRPPLPLAPLAPCVLCSSGFCPFLQLLGSCSLGLVVSRRGLLVLVFFPRADFRRDVRSGCLGL